MEFSVFSFVQESQRVLALFPVSGLSNVEASRAYGLGAVAGMVTAGLLKPQSEIIRRVMEANTLAEVLDVIAEFRKVHVQEGN